MVSCGKSATLSSNNEENSFKILNTIIIFNFAGTVPHRRNTGINTIAAHQETFGIKAHQSGNRLNKCLILGTVANIL